MSYTSDARGKGTWSKGSFRSSSCKAGSSIYFSIYETREASPGVSSVPFSRIYFR